jgi:N-acetylneuraminic acid mutarotase
VNDRWTARAAVPEPLTHTPVVVDGRFFYLVGGFVGDSPGGATAHVWRYDTVADSWTAAPPLPAPRGAGGAAIVGRTIHYFGGVDREPGCQCYIDEDEHWALDLTEQNPAWRPRKPMPGPHNHLAGAGLGGIVYAIGGQKGGDQKMGNQARVDAYDPATDSWRSVAPMPVARGHINAAIFTANGSLWVVGGTENDSTSRNGRPSTEVSEFDPLLNSWRRTRLSRTVGRTRSPVIWAIASR